MAENTNRKLKPSFYWWFSFSLSLCACMLMGSQICFFFFSFVLGFFSSMHINFLLYFSFFFCCQVIVLLFVAFLHLTDKRMVKTIVSFHLFVLLQWQYDLQSNRKNERMERNKIEWKEKDNVWHLRAWERRKLLTFICVCACVRERKSCSACPARTFPMRHCVTSFLFSLIFI